MIENIILCQEKLTRARRVDVVIFVLRGRRGWQMAHCREISMAVAKAKIEQHPDGRKIYGLRCKGISETSTIGSEQ